jgi:hypothetical protein
MEKWRVAVAMIAPFEAAATDSEAMRTGSPAMQKNLANHRIGARAAFDREFGHAYSCGYVSPTRHRVDLLLSCDAGVWVGTQAKSSHPPGKAGGFCFIRL